jgi:tRNA G18 (ribose-2'-O)-methylase SpoU
VTREQVYGRRPVREALRGRREVLELWSTERALAAEPWLHEVNGRRVHVKPERELTEQAGTRDHQGVLAFCEPYTSARSCAAPRARARAASCCRRTAPRT